MKIGILTYHRAHNYGAVLQAYALLNFLKGQDLNAEIIDYWPDYHEEDYKLIPYYKSRSIFGKIVGIILLVIGYSKFTKRAFGYKHFIKEQFSLTDSALYKSAQDLNSSKYDLVIYGSDQIWRRSNYPIFKGFSDVYFGCSPINVKRKITYAASMGIIDIQEKDHHYLKDMLNNFEIISVRERELKLLVEQTFLKPVQIVLDPIFLLSKEEWLRNIKIPIPKLKDKKYILFYHLIPSKEAREFTNYVKNIFDYEVIEIRGRVNPFLFGKQYLQTASPFEFLSLINNAELVVTNSFHGVAFSLLFEKQFYALGFQKNIGRVQSLLDELEIGNRIITDKKNFNIRQKINYNSVNSKIYKLIQISKKFLLESI